ncbi:hypothetical protein [Rivularia sp. PCC 7116]|nr:hypothetical protein [Rivularia sp. PCC 7116]
MPTKKPGNADHARRRNTSLADNEVKRRFHAACALRGRKMSQVVTEMIER